jgi:hypothetical protein
MTGPAQCRLLRHRGQALRIRIAGTSPGPADVRISDLASGAPRIVATEALADRPGSFRRELALTTTQLGDADWLGLGFDRPGLIVDDLELVEETRRPKVVVLGLDALSWRILDPLLAAGRLPHFQALIREGVAGPLRSAQPLLSPIIWTTIATGQGHGAHGIHGFVDDDHRLVNSTQVKVKRVWEIVGDHAGATVGIAGWFVTWPVEPVTGFMLSDRATSVTPNDKERPLSFQPAALQETFEPVVRERQRRYIAEMRRFTPLAIDPEWRSHFASGTPEWNQHAAIDPIFLRAFLRDSAYVEGGLDLLRSLAPDLFMLYLRGSDHAQHGYWFHRAPGESLTPVDAEDRRLFGGIIDNYYVYLDEVFGRFMDAAPKDTTFMVVSDHGFHSEVRGQGDARRAAAHHEPEGVYVIRGPGFRRGLKGQELSVFDLAPLWLHLYGLPAARDMRGRVPLELLDPRPAQEPPRIDSYGRRAATESSRESAADAEIVEQLKALGYIQ